MYLMKLKVHVDFRCYTPYMYKLYVLFNHFPFEYDLLHVKTTHFCLAMEY